MKSNKDDKRLTAVEDNGKTISFQFQIKDDIKAARIEAARRT